MITALEIVLLISVLVVFVWDSVAFTIHAAMLKALLMRVESAEHKLRQMPLPVETDIERSECECESEYAIPPIPNSREMNSSGVPIARRGIVGDEPPAE